MYIFCSLLLTRNASLNCYNKIIMLLFLHMFTIEKFDDVFEIFNYTLRCYVSFKKSNQVTIANVINDFTAESIEGPSDVEKAINGAIQLGHTVPGMRYNVTEDTKANSTCKKIIGGSLT